MTTASAHHLPWTLVVPIPSTTSASFSMRRRTLYRALAVVVALGSITPLFAEPAQEGPRRNQPNPADQLPGSQPR